ncbi:phage tail protein [Haliangium sp.]|uniref:phage tail protein n=1 Tax=Haliangium sp. TaxID=2663208 RepID=UPI003D10AAA5
MTTSDLFVPGFRFIVTLHPADAFLPASISLLATLVPAAAFKEVSGLSGELEVMSYAEGGVNDKVHQLPVRHSWSRITLKRGIVLGGGLWDWYAAGLQDPLGSRRDGTILLLSLQGIPMMAWHFTAGLAAKWSGPDLDATADALAMESLEIAHEGLEFIGLSASMFS